MMMLRADYGQFSPIVAASGTIIAMGSALALGWRGRSRWEPIEEDLSKAPQKVGGLISAVVVALIWAEFNNAEYNSTLVRVAAYCLGATLLSLVIYTLLFALVYERDTGKRHPQSGDPLMEKVIGGLWLRKTARSKIGTPGGPDNIQDLFDGAAYQKNRLWSGLSQQCAKVMFILSYIGLTAAGTVALGAASIIISWKMKSA